MRARGILAALLLLALSGAWLGGQEGGTEASAQSPAPSEGAPSEDIPAPVPEPKQGLAVTGRAWADITALAPFGEEYDSGDIAYSGAVAARLNILNLKREVLKFEASFDAGLLYGKAAEAQRALALGALSGLPPSLLAALGLTGNDFSGFSFDLKKLSLGLDLGPFGITLGRQIFNSGRAEVFSPADLFSSPDLSGLQAGRRGMDLARLGLALGQRSGLAAVAKPGIDPARGDYALRAYSGFRDFDAAIQGARRMGLEEGQGSWMLTADFKADLFLGIYGEAALSLRDSDSPALRASLGTDYSVNRELFLRAEYYYNGLSGKASAETSSYGADPLSAFDEKHYLYAALSWIASDELSLGAYWYGALSAASGSGTASLSYLAAQNAQLIGFLRLGYDDPLNVMFGARMEVKF
jgi:hypothetical protein